MTIEANGFDMSTEAGEERFARLVTLLRKRVRPGEMGKWIAIVAPERTELVPRSVQIGRFRDAGLTEQADRLVRRRVPAGDLLLWVETDGAEGCDFVTLPLALIASTAAKRRGR